MGKLPKADPSVTTPAEKSASAEETDTEQKSAVSRKVRGQVFIDAEQCKGCGLCIAFCPRHVLERSEHFNSKGYYPPVAVQPEDCTGCDLCGHFCPDFAIFGIRLRPVGEAAANEEENKEEKEKKP